jgi:hypothetical protein
MKFDFIQDTINSFLTLLFKYINLDVEISILKDDKNVNGLYNIVVSPLWSAKEGKVEWTIKVTINQVVVNPLPSIRMTYDAPHQKDIVDKTEGFMEIYYSVPITTVTVLSLIFDTASFPSLITLYEKISAALLLHKPDLVILGKMKDLSIQFSPIYTNNIPNLQVLIQIVKDYIITLSTDYRLLGTIGEVKYQNDI